MRFGAPWAFAALLLVPLLAGIRAWSARLERRRLEAAGAPELVRALVDEGPSAGRLRKLRAALIALALLATCFALARPQLGMRTEVRKGRGMDVVLALDLSRSMHARDVAPSRLKRAKLELVALLDRLRGDRAGLVGFTSVGLPLCPLTVDHAALKVQLASASPDSLPRGGTSIDAAIRAGLRMLEAAGHPEADRAIVVLTDGEAHLGDPVAAAEEARKQGVVVHVAGVGSRVGEPIPILNDDGAIDGYVKDRSGKTVVSRLEDGALRSIAQAGGGLAALPEGDGGLDLSPIVAELSALQRAELEARTVRVYEERYAWALAPAFLLLLAATLIRPARAHRLPRLALGFALTLAPGPAHAQALFERGHPDVETGIAALAAGRPEEASEAFERAREALGDDPRLAYDKALADAARGELDQAMDGFRSAAAQAADPNLRARARYALGNALRSLERYDEAARAYRQALLDDPELSGARRNLEIAQRMKAVQQAQPKSDDGEGEPGEDGDRDRSEDDAPKDPSEEDDRSEDEEQDRSEGEEEEDPSEGEQDPSEGEQNPSEGQEDPSEGEREDRPGGNDAGPGEDGGSGEVGGTTGDDAPDAGVSGDAGPSPAGGGDAGTREEAPDAGAGGGARAAPAPDLSRQEAEAILDALQAEEEALERKRLLERFKGRRVEKDW